MYRSVSLVPVIALCICLAVAGGAPAQAISADSVFDNVFRISIGLNADEVIAAYDQDYDTQLVGGSDFNIYSVDPVVNSKVPQYIRATSNQNYFTDADIYPDSDCIILIEDEVIYFRMKRWGTHKHWQDFVEYLSTDKQLGPPVNPVDGTLLNRYGVSTVEEGVDVAYWMDPRTEDVFIAKFEPYSTIQGGLLTLQLMAHTMQAQ